MSLMPSIQALYTRQRIEHILKTETPLESTVLDDLFPRAQRKQWNSPLVPLSHLHRTIKCVPVISRNGMPIPISGKDLSNVWIEPMPVSVSDDVDGVTINNLKLMDMGSREQWVNESIQAGRLTVSATNEALASQAAFNGKITWPKKLDTGEMITYEVSYGDTIQEYAPEVAWNHADATLTHIYMDLKAMATKLDRAGFGGQKVVYLGEKVFILILKLMQSTTKDSQVVFKLADDGTIKVPSFVIKEMSEVYTHPQTGATVSKLPADEIRVISKGYTTMNYTALDDMRSNLQPLPLFVCLNNKDRRKWELLSESKPLPGIAPKSVCKAKVLTEQPAEQPGE